MARGGTFYQGEDTRAPAVGDPGTLGQVWTSNGPGADPTMQDSTGGVTVKEVDGSPNVSGVTTIVVSNGTLTDDGGGQVTVTTGGGGGGSGAVVQVVSTHTGEVATGTTQIPFDDTIPQNTEGTEFMTLAITPTNSSNKLLIQVTFNAGPSTTPRWVTAALFQDSTADALATGMHYVDSAAGQWTTATFTHYMTAGTTSATTFKVRIGLNDTGTVTFNGASGSRYMGGVMASSITITEIVP